MGKIRMPLCYTLNSNNNNVYRLYYKESYTCFKMKVPDGMG